MSITDFTRPLALVLALGLGSAAVAQETAAPATPEAPAALAAPAAPAAPAVPPSEPAGPGSLYLKATHGDWQLRCVKAEQGEDPCQLYQLLKDQQGNSVSEIAIFPLPAGQQAAAGATIITPLETLLTENVILQVDSQQPKTYPFTWCDRGGCVARVGFTAEELAGLKKGAKITMLISPVVAPNEKVTLTVSLKGFTAGFEAMPAPTAPAQ